MSQAIVSQLDIDHLQIIRGNVSRFLSSCKEFVVGPGKLLDIAPQVHEGAKPHFPQAEISTLDIDPNSGATFVADLCRNNSDQIPGEYFDWVVCTEVLEHTLNPFAAVEEMNRILKKGGYLFASAPYNFRIHGPLPDCWRFTEHGWRALLSHGMFEVVRLEGVKTEGRDLMPVHYTVVARKV